MRRSGPWKKIVRCGIWTGLFLCMICNVAGCGRTKVPTGTVGTEIPTPTGQITTGAVTRTPVPTPEPTETPGPTEEPTATKPPEQHVSPEPTKTPTPEVTVEPELTITPEPTETPTPGVTEGPEPTVTPEAQPTIAPGPTPVPGEPTPTPVPEVTPAGSATETPTPTPEADPTATPEPEPTPDVTPEVSPDYEALLAGGWQKTEDFFGRRELYFPGKYNETTLYAESGRYEYRYGAAEEPEVTFSVIGEEGLAVQLFLDSLTQKGDACTVWTEGENDYGYTYTEGTYTVTGRVYGCDTETTSRRMRVEFCYPTEKLQTEDYIFYIK